MLISYRGGNSVMKSRAYLFLFVQASLKFKQEWSGEREYNNWHNEIKEAFVCIHAIIYDWYISKI